jgi:hypothetical protein
MKSRFRNETSVVFYISHETNSVITIFTTHGSIAGQLRSKLVDSPTIYRTTPTGSDLGIEK